MMPNHRAKILAAAKPSRKDASPFNHSRCHEQAHHGVRMARSSFTISTQSSNDSRERIDASQRLAVMGLGLRLRCGQPASQLAQRGTKPGGRLI
jgi:hypothetical protein